MEKLLGILPYIYFFGGPVQLGPVKFIGVPDWQGRNHAPVESSDRASLQELSKCFPVSRGLKSGKGAIRAITYFLLDSRNGGDNQTISEARKAITLLRYMMLCPDSPAVNDIETSSIYIFELPPAGKDEYRIYHGWINFNQEEWITAPHQRFHPPGWHVDFRIVSSGNLEGLDEIKNRFYNDRLNSELEAEVLLSMEWYNLSFQKYSIRGIAGHLVDIATAFETLFQLPQSQKTQEFRRRIRESLGTEEGSVLDEWATRFYKDVRSETVHTGKPSSYLFKHPAAQTPHLSFLWSAQRIFRECIAAELGIERHLLNEHLIEQLTPNEVILKRLRTIGSFRKIRDAGSLWEIWKLRQVYPVGERDDIVWLGKTLLSELARRLAPKGPSSLLSTVESILSTGDNDEMLSWRYIELVEQFKRVSLEDTGEGVKELAQASSLAFLVRYFAEFAWYALSVLHFNERQKGHNS